MKRILTICIILSLLTLNTFAHEWTASITVSEPIRCYGLKGKVTASWTGLTPPIAILLDGEEVGRDEQNGDGSFVITNVPAGFHTFTIEEDPLVPLEVHSKTLFDTIPEPDSFRVVSTNIVKPSFGQSNGSIYLEIAGGIKPYDMQWDTDPIQHGPMVKNVPADYYIMSMNDANGCDFAHLVDLENGAISSISNVGAANNNELIYPNPCTSGKLYLPEGVQELRLFSINGQLIKTSKITGAREWNVEDYPQGCYLIELLRADSRMRSILVIE